MKRVADLHEQRRAHQEDQRFFGRADGSAMTFEHEQEYETGDRARTYACADGKGNREDRLPKSARAWASRSRTYAAGSEFQKTENREIANTSSIEAPARITANITLNCIACIAPRATGIPLQHAGNQDERCQTRRIRFRTEHHGRSGFDSSITLVHVPHPALPAVRRTCKTKRV